MSDSGRARREDMTVAELAVEMLEAEASQLDTWADESERGGWSTHQVQPMRRRADEIRRSLGYWRSKRG
jgi:hypothetical protein